MNFNTIFLKKGKLPGKIVLKQFTTIRVVETLLFTQTRGFLPGVIASVFINFTCSCI